MSLGARGGAKGGAKGGSGKDKHGQEKKDKPQPKEKVKPQATTEQIRLANMIDRKTTDDGADVRKMVQDLMEMTCRTEEEVCSALHDADNDMLVACNILLETAEQQGEWQTSEKKKKKPPQPVNNGEAAPRDRERGPPGPRPRRGEGAGGRGSTRGGRGGRGFGRGGARGARAPPRSRHDPSWQPSQYNDTNQMGDTFPATEDWDNEEWSGSLSDTKVFTPSAAAAAPEAEGLLPPAEDWEGASAPEPHAVPAYTYHNAQPHLANLEQLNNAAGHASPGAAEAEAEAPPDLYLQQMHAPQVGKPMGMSGSLSAAQTQYLSQLTQQSQRHDASVYAANYGVYGSSDIASQRKPQRARVPPPSKIPMSAVEMPGGMGEGNMFLDVQFGALEPESPPPAAPAPAPTPAAPRDHKHAQSPPAAPHPAAEAAPEPAAAPYAHPQPHAPPHQPLQQLNESLSSVEAAPAASQPLAPVAEPPQAANATTPLDAALSGAMKQLAVSAPDHAPYPHHHRPKPAAPAGGAAQSVYAHHPVAHHPQVYSANVYAPQVNSSNASLSAAAAAAGISSGYPSSVTLTQYQPILNSYQTSSSAGVYNNAALYTAAAPYSYQPQPHHNNKHKETTHQYESSSVASSNSLTSTSTTQTSTAKVATTTAGHTAATGASSAAGGAYAGGALYGSQGYAYDDQIMRSTMPHHMGGYYEVGYGVSGARDGAFGLGAGERFGRTDAASPQQVPAAALPPGYAYFYQPPPPTTYQYGVYPTYGGGSSVGGVSGGGKVANYAQQQPQYDQQDTYKPGGGYGASGSKAGGAAAADINSAMYAKGHVALNKVNSYEKAGFHSGTPPPFGAASHLYIPAPPLHHHPVHQMDVRMNTSSHNRRQESGTTGGRASTNKAAHSKPTYSHSYWPPN